MDIHIDELADKIGYTAQTLRLLLDRAEFSDIRPIASKKIVRNITQDHIDRLVEIRDRKKLPARWKGRERNRYVQIY